MLDSCANCDVPVIYYSASCPDHRCVGNNTEGKLLKIVREERATRVLTDKERRVTLDDLAQVVAGVTKTSKSDLVSGTYANHEITLARRLFKYAGYMLLGYRQREVGQYLKQSAASVCMGASKIREEASTDRHINEVLNEITKRVAELPA